MRGGARVNDEHARIPSFAGCASQVDAPAKPRRGASETSAVSLFVVVASPIGADNQVCVNTVVFVPVFVVPAAAGVILDVRTPDHFAEGHRAGAVNVPVSGSSFGTRAAFVLPDQTLPPPLPPPELAELPPIVQPVIVTPPISL